MVKMCCCTPSELSNRAKAKRKTVEEQKAAEIPVTQSS